MYAFLSFYSTGDIQALQKHQPLEKLRFVLF